MKQSITEMSNIFKILSNEVRLCILVNLCNSEEKRVTDLQCCSNSSQSFVSQQLSKLRALGIVSSHRNGVETYYYLTDKKICDIIKKLGLVNNKCKNKEEI